VTANITLRKRIVAYGATTSIDRHDHLDGEHETTFRLAEGPGAQGRYAWPEIAMALDRLERRFAVRF
jgi:hypothetical protein